MSTYILEDIASGCAGGDIEQIIIKKKLFRVW